MARASDVLAIARAELGEKESPAGSNNVKYNTWFYGQPVHDGLWGTTFAWCMAFVMWVFAQAKMALPVRTAGCGAFMNAAKKAGRWITSGFRPGDVVIFDFPGGGKTDHCGIVKEVRGNTIVCYEGNTGIGNEANGGQVQQRQRSLSLVVGAYRPDYESEDEFDMDVNEARAAMTSCIGTGDNPGKVFKEATDYCKKKGIFNGNGKGDFGWQQPITREAVAQILYNTLEAAGLLDSLPDVR